MHAGTNQKVRSLILNLASALTLLISVAISLYTLLAVFFLLASGARFYETLMIPFTLATASAVIFFVIALVLKKKADNTDVPQQDSCPACAYNLTGNISGVCPECGTRLNPST